MPTKNLLVNVDMPAPRWYRKCKRIIALLSGPTFFAFVSIFNPTDRQLAVIGQVIAFIPTVLEIFNAVLTNGQEYAPQGTKQALADVTGEPVKDVSGIVIPTVIN